MPAFGLTVKKLPLGIPVGLSVSNHVRTSREVHAAPFDVVIWTVCGVGCTFGTPTKFNGFGLSVIPTVPGVGVRGGDADGLAPGVPVGPGVGLAGRYATSFENELSLPVESYAVAAKKY